jgi:hypothetical protein
LIVEITATPDSPASGGRALFEISVKNDGSVRADNVAVTISVPESAAYVGCKTSARTTCDESGGVVTTNLGSIRAHRVTKVSLTLKMPAVDRVTELTLTADANGNGVAADRNSLKFEVLPPIAAVQFLPSLRPDFVSCGDTIQKSWYGSDHTAMLQNGLGCATTDFGLKMAASGKTFNLNGNKIVGETRKGNVGMLIAAGATDVTIEGRGTSSTKGIEFFDWCVKDEGDNDGLVITDLRCYRARSAAIDIVSSDVEISSVKIDNTAFVQNATEESPGGIGIHASGDNILVRNTIVRRSRTIGILADGTDADDNERVLTVDGGLNNSRVEDNSGIGVLFATGFNQLKDTFVSGSGPSGVPIDGIIVAEGTTGNVLDGAVVKNFSGNGYMILGTGTQVLRSQVENVGLDGFVIVGPATYLKNNEAHPLGRGFVVGALATGTFLDTNTAAAGSDGFVVDAASEVRLDGNSATGNGGNGFVINGTAWLNTNKAETNLGNGFVIAGDGNRVENGTSKLNGGIGFNVPGRGNTLNTNKAEANAGPEFVIGRNNIDVPFTNSANGTRISFTSAGGTFQ